MNDRHKVKITVLKRMSPGEVFKKLPVTPASTLGECDLYENGQEFIVSENGRMPEGFCGASWNAIYTSVRVLAFGGNMPWFKEKGVSVDCCTDGLRPVIFKLERI